MPCRAGLGWAGLGTYVHVRMEIYVDFDLYGAFDMRMRMRMGMGRV